MGCNILYMLARESALLAATVTAFMKAARTPAFSSSCTPAMVVPAPSVKTHVKPSVDAHCNNAQHPQTDMPRQHVDREFMLWQKL